LILAILLLIDSGECSVVQIKTFLFSFVAISNAKMVAYVVFPTPPKEAITEVFPVGNRPKISSISPCIFSMSSTENSSQAFYAIDACSIYKDRKANALV
jgi:hypothetical protein